MKQYKIIFTFLFSITFFASCNDSFLEREPSDAISTTTFFQQEKDLVFAVNAVYDIIAFNNWGTNYGSGTDMLRTEIMTDNALDHHSWNDGYRLGNGTASAFDGYSTVRWNERYKGIQRVNRILEGVDGIEDIDESYKNQLLAEVITLRAYFYFDLVYLFGDVPFLTSSISPDDVSPAVDEEGNFTAAELAKRIDKNSVLDALITDLDKITLNLPLVADEKGRVTRGTALFLKAKILLFQEKWEASAQASKSLMDLGVYSLHNTYADLFNYEGIGNNEVILDVQVKQDVDEGEFYTKNFGPNSVGGWSSSCPLQSLVDSYECTDGLTINDSPLYDPNNPYDNRDPRLKYTILYPGHDWRGGVFNSIPGATYPGENIIPGDVLGDGTGGEWNKTATGYNWLKYMSNKDVDDSNFWDGGVHLMLMRYSEALLMYAEAKIEAGSIDQTVYNAINQIRQRSDVNMPSIPMGLSQDELRIVVRRERRIELAFEGQRLFDIRRWDIAKDVMPGVPTGLTYKDENNNDVTFTWGERFFDPNKHNLWPIPQEEVDLSHIEQNPGW
ncbi:MAG: RagB/SusD family nutrient uptake outer membrane protein [Labilibaculum sp.]|nr:RagB/SusD family nutrient uptake outer membrane protein [Labilibaculum sp.]